MAKKVIRLAVIGFILGAAIGNVISLLSGGPSHMATDKALSMTGGSVAGALILQSVIEGLMGAANFAGVALYEAESLNLVKATLFHFLIVLGTYFPTAFFLGWIKIEVLDIAVMTLIMAAAFFVIWLIFYLIYRKQTKELNELQKKFSK